MANNSRNKKQNWHNSGCLDLNATINFARYLLSVQFCYLFGIEKIKAMVLLRNKLPSHLLFFLIEFSPEIFVGQIEEKINFLPEKLRKLKRGLLNEINNNDRPTFKNKRLQEVSLQYFTI